MAETKALRDLVPTSDLRRNILDRYVESGGMVYIRYDSMFDAFFMMFAPPDTETVVHHITDEIGLLCEPESHEIVGIQIEYFTYKFLQENQELLEAWDAIQAGTVGDVSDVMRVCKSLIVESVAKASNRILSQKKLNLPKFQETIPAHHIVIF